MPVIELKEQPKKKLVVQYDLFAYFQECDRSAKEYEAAVKDAVKSEEFGVFKWDPSNPHAVATPVAYADRTSIVVDYDVAYYRGTEDPELKYSALRRVAATFANIYVALHPGRRVRVTLRPVNVQDPSAFWPVVYCSSPKVA